MYLNSAVELQIFPIDDDGQYGLSVQHVNQSEFIFPKLHEFITDNNNKTAAICLKYKKGNQLWFFKNKKGGLILGRKISKIQAMTSQ